MLSGLTIGSYKNCSVFFLNIYIENGMCDIYSFGSTMLAMHARVYDLTPISHVKQTNKQTNKPGVVVCPHNPNTGEVEKTHRPASLD